MRSGRENLFELDPEPIRQVREDAASFQSGGIRALARLKAFVER